MRKALLLGAALTLVLTAPVSAQILRGGGPVGSIGSTVNSSTLSRTTIDPGRTTTVDTTNQTDNSTSSRIRTRHRDTKVAGGANASANGSASVTAPSARPLVDQTRDTAGQAAGYARGSASDTVGAERSAGRTVVGAASHASPSASFSASGNANSNNARASGSAGLSISPGFAVRDTAGRSLGRVVRVVRDRTGQAETIVVKSADGTLHSLRASDVSVSGNTAVANSASAGGSVSSPHR
jgi:hypothetical protein